MNINKKYDGIITKEIHLDYRLHLPNDYDESESEGYPMILFLHGSGERGNDINKLKRTGLTKYVEEHDDFPFIVVAPQCNEKTWWTRELDGLYALVKHIVNELNVDEKRMYLTGLSMGGFGCWHLAERYPKLFTAMIPIASGTEEYIGFPERVEILKDLPIWAFHGAKDPIVPVMEIKKLMPYLGDKFKYTEYPEGMHDVWTETYENKEIYAWLLKHSK